MRIIPALRYESEDDEGEGSWTNDDRRPTLSGKGDCIITITIVFLNKKELRINKQKEAV